MFESLENTELSSSLEGVGTLDTSQINAPDSLLSRQSHATAHNHGNSHVPGSTSAIGRNSARREAELIYARARISELELELSKTQHAAKRARIESGEREDGEKLTTRVSQELQRLHSVRREYSGSLPPSLPSFPPSLPPPPSLTPPSPPSLPPTHPYTHISWIRRGRVLQSS